MINEIKKTMLGHVPCNIQCVAITPLKSTFYRLKERLDIKEGYLNCFFENYVFNVNNKKKGMIILAPQGIAAKDIIELFDNTNILFFGLAGSINSKIKIGNMFEVEFAIDERGNDYKLNTTGIYKTVKCGYSPCLLGNIAKEYCDIAKKNECDIVDMETVYCAKTAIELNNKFVSLQLISDIPEIINFWELDEQKKNELKKYRRLAINKIIEEINYLCNVK